MNKIFFLQLSKKKQLKLAISIIWNYYIKIGDFPILKYGVIFKTHPYYSQLNTSLHYDDVFIVQKVFPVFITISSYRYAKHYYQWIVQRARHAPVINSVVNNSRINIFVTTNVKQYSNFLFATLALCLYMLPRRTRSLF